MPPMQVPEGTGWKSGEKPAVTAGLKIEAIASGLMHPPQLYTLPNGDILVVESNSPGTEPVTTPKQLIAGIVKTRTGKGGKGRSEEHTSELQSLMRISYTVLCLIKKQAIR